MLLKCIATITLLIGTATVARAKQAPRLAPPPPEKLYQGFYYDGPDVNEHDVTAKDVTAYEAALGKKTAWVFLSDNWFESRAFPDEMCGWIRDEGKVPYVRLMLRSDLDQNHAEKVFSLANILAGKFDEDLKAWARNAHAFETPILIEWGTEPNGKWFAWNGKWNGGGKLDGFGDPKKPDGPERFVAAYRHIVDLMRAEGADNLQWIWHVNWFDEPESKWNAFENYYPGDSYCDWTALSAYGPLTPQAKEGYESFRYKIDLAYPRLVKVAPSKPLIIAEFGCEIHHHKISAAHWADAALTDLLSHRWPAVIGFCWWSESWENDDTKGHDTDMNILHDPSLTKVFRDQLTKHATSLQEEPIFATKP